MATALATRKQPDLATREILSKLLTKQKIDDLALRVNEAIKPFTEKQKKLAQQIAKLEIKDQASYDRAAELRAQIKGNADDALELVDPSRELAHQLWKTFTTATAACNTAEKENLTALDAKLKVFDDAVAEENRKRERAAQLKAQEDADKERRDREEKERKAKEKADKDQADADERRRLADEAAAKARESENPIDKKEAHKLAKLAENAEARADSAQAELSIAEAVRQEPIEAAPITYQRAVRRAASAGTLVDNWSGVCDDVWCTIRFILGVDPAMPLKHPEYLLLVASNEPELNRTAKAQKNLMSIPGCRAVNNPFRR